jgi:MscS family membrane protein
MVFARSVIWLLLAFVPVAAQAQTPGPDASEPKATAATPVASTANPLLIRKLKSPRTAMKTFLDAVNNDNLQLAALCLDLSQLQAADEAHKKKSEEYAYKLKDTIDRITRVQYFVIPDDPDHEDDYQLTSGQAIYGKAAYTAATSIILSRGNDNLWRFNTATVENIDELWQDAQSRDKVSGLVKSQATKPPQVWLREQFPPFLQKKHFLLRYYQWICLGILIFVGFAAEFLVRHGLQWLTNTWFRFMDNGERKRAEKATWRPLGLLAQALVWYGGTKLIDLPPMVLSVLFIAMKAFAVFAAVWTAFRLIDVFAHFWLRRTASTETKFDDLLVKLVSKSLKTLGICLGVVLFAQLFSLDVWGIMGGLGIGGIAVAFAAKEALGNLFGSITVLTDRPFEIGDWIITEDIEGTVESVGMRSTRIRTFYNSQVTLPNSRMTTAVVDNMGRRHYRRIKEVLGVEYQTKPQQLESFCEGIRELILQHPHTRKDYFHVYFNGYGESSLNILVYCFLACPDWGAELREKHRLLSDIYHLADALNIRFAFPSQTVYLQQNNDHPTDTPTLPYTDKQGRNLAKQIAG